MTDSPEPLSAEEEAEMRLGHPIAEQSCETCRVLATLDRERAASERPPVGPLREAALGIIAWALDEEHCCNDPDHMSAEYAARLSDTGEEP